MAQPKVIPTDKVDWNEADIRWGYRFGCDGLRRNIDAAKFLGVSRHTIYQLVKSDKIRTGQGGKICFRSLLNYAHSLEI